MKGILLSIDPGKITGWARINIKNEKVELCGEVKVVDSGYIKELGCQMGFADYLVIEDQYLDKNVDSLIKLAALRGGLQMLWAVRKNHKTLGISCLLVKPSRWQAALNIPNKAGREQRKRASLFQAKALTRTKDITVNMADAICMGLAIARRLKAAKGSISI